MLVLKSLLFHLKERKKDRQRSSLKPQALLLITSTMNRSPLWALEVRNSGRVNGDRSWSVFFRKCVMRIIDNTERDGGTWTCQFCLPSSQRVSLGRQERRAKISQVCSHISPHPSHLVPQRSLMCTEAPEPRAEFTCVPSARAPAVQTPKWRRSCSRLHFTREISIGAQLLWSLHPQVEPAPRWWEQSQGGFCCLLKFFLCMHSANI